MAQRTAANWPENLTDPEAIQRLETLCLGACDGIQDLADDARYKATRKALLKRDDLRPFVPEFVAAQANLEAFVRYVRTIKERSARRDNVRQSFRPLWDAIGGQEELASSAWTGRPSLQQQLTIVRSLAPIALEAVERLIAEEEYARSNGGPVDPDRNQALVHLRELHQALGELIVLADQNRPLEGALKKLQSIKQEAKVTLGKAAAAVPVTASALIAFGSVVGIADFFTGNVVVSLAAGVMAGNTMKDSMLKKEKS